MDDITQKIDDHLTHKIEGYLADDRRCAVHLDEVDRLRLCLGISELRRITAEESAARAALARLAEEQERARAEHRALLADLCARYAIPEGASVNPASGAITRAPRTEVQG